MQSSFSQSKKILSHHRFLVKLQRQMKPGHSPSCSELQPGRPVQTDKVLQAVQTALCCVENAFAHLSIKRRKWTLLYLNKQLVPIAEEELTAGGSLFRSKFGKMPRRGLM